jgi:hypothetical protein
VYGCQGPSNSLRAAFCLVHIGRKAASPGGLAKSASGLKFPTDDSRKAPYNVKIAQVAPLFERVPPRYYGGTERVVSYLTEELVRQGHDVTLFASADSITAARLW